MSDDVRLQLLADNAAGEGLLSEHGFSAWIEAGGRRILFDTGQGPALQHNARALDVPLATTDTLVLSHGHYDHTGGVPYALDRAPALHVYAHPAATSARYSIHSGAPRAIGIPLAARAALAALPAGRLHATTGPEELAPGIGLAAAIPRRSAFEDAGGPFFFDASGRAPDPIADDLALWFRTGRGLVLVVGCCHAGLVNTLRFAQEQSGEARVHAIVGGLHLGAASRERLDRTVAALVALCPELVVPCHCTGPQAIGHLRDALGERVQPGAAGATFTFGGFPGSPGAHPDREERS